MMIVKTKEKFKKNGNWNKKLAFKKNIYNHARCHPLRKTRTLCGYLTLGENMSIMIRESVKICLNNSFQITHSSEKISNIIRDLNKVKTGEEYHKLDKFIKKRIARETYQCKHQTFINTPMKQKLKYLEKYLPTLTISSSKHQSHT